MGTRSLTQVIDENGNVKVSQYGQWDGHLESVGTRILNILKDKDKVEKLKQSLKSVRFFDYDNPNDKIFLDDYESKVPQYSNEPDYRTIEQKTWFEKFISRDLAEKVLLNIIDNNSGEILLQDSSNTAIEDGWVAFTYRIDFQKNKFIISDKLDTPILQEYDLNNLPTDEEFLELKPSKEKLDYFYC